MPHSENRHFTQSPIVRAMFRDQQRVCRSARVWKSSKHDLVDAHDDFFGGEHRDQERRHGSCRGGGQTGDVLEGCSVCERDGTASVIIRVIYVVAKIDDLMALRPATA